MQTTDITEIMRSMIQQGRLPSGALAILGEAIKEIEALREEVLALRKAYVADQ